jgi:hypothetical protein
MRRRLLLLLLLSLAALACVEERHIPLYRARCLSDRACAQGTLCLDGVCARGERSPPEPAPPAPRYIDRDVLRASLRQPLPRLQALPRR